MIQENDTGEVDRTRSWNALFKTLVEALGFRFEF